jgi:hypothetical protein
VGEVFHELHLSSNAAFDQSSGALRGLLGRLDVLIVIDASSPAIARLRAVETETGAVRGIATCKRSRSLFGGASDGEQNCVHGFVTQLEPSIRAILTVKEKRNADQAAEQQRRTAEMIAQRQAADAAQQRALRLETQERKEAIKQQEVETKASQAQAETEQRDRQAIQSQLSALQPSLEVAMSRLSSTTAFWNDMGREMAKRGQSLRSEIQSRLRAANSNGARCQALFDAGQPNTLRTCTGELGRRLDELDTYK